MAINAATNGNHLPERVVLRGADDGGEDGVACLLEAIAHDGRGVPRAPRFAPSARQAVRQAWRLLRVSGLLPRGIIRAAHEARRVRVEVRAVADRHHVEGSPAVLRAVEGPQNVRPMRERHERTVQLGDGRLALEHEAGHRRHQPCHPLVQAAFARARAVSAVIAVAQREQHVGAANGLHELSSCGRAVLGDRNAVPAVKSDDCTTLLTSTTRHSARE